METLNINEKGYKERYSQIMDKSEMKTQETKTLSKIRNQIILQQVDYDESTIKTVLIDSKRGNKQIILFTIII